MKRCKCLSSIKPTIRHEPVGEKPAETVTLWIYTGADGKFTLDEDDSLTYGYEKGAFAQIPFRWNDATKTLSIGQRTGAFPGMLTDRTFNLVLVSANQTLGYSATPKPNLSVNYHGEAMEVPVLMGL